MTTDLDALVDSVVDDHDHNTSDTTTRGRSYVDAISVRDISTDHTYQRPLDNHRVGRMVAEYDQSLVGVIEVSLRPDGSYRVIDGQHRLAMVRQVRGMGAHVACNVHTGLTAEQEAQLFFDIDKKRRRLTGWDRWNARRGAGEPIVLDIERTAHAHGLKIDPSPKPMHLRCVAACEKLVALAGLPVLDDTLQVCVDAYCGEPDSLRAEIVHGVGLVLTFYPDLDRTRLVSAMQGIAARQLSARAAALRETVSGQLPRLAASVLIDRYNAEPGRRVTPFLKHVTSGKAHTPPDRTAANEPHARRHRHRRDRATHQRRPHGHPQRGRAARSDPHPHRLGPHRRRHRGPAGHVLTQRPPDPQDPPHRDHVDVRMTLTLTDLFANFRPLPDCQEQSMAGRRERETKLLADSAVAAWREAQAC